MGRFTLSRNSLLISVVCVFVISPILAYIFASQTLKKSDDLPTFTPPQRDTNLLANTISRDRDDLGNNSYPEVVITSFERVKSNWYVVKAVSKSDSKSPELIFLIGDFYYNPKKMVVITNPNQSFYRLNTSKDAVPYDVIERVRSLKSNQGEHHD